jgi:flagellar protein FliO/FliZ
MIELFKMLASLVLVFGLMGLLLWALRRMQQKMQTTGHGQIKLVDNLHLGPRQKIALIEVDNQRLVVGINGQQMTALGQWPAPANNTATGAGHEPA